MALIQQLLSDWVGILSLMTIAVNDPVVIVESGTPAWVLGKVDQDQSRLNRTALNFRNLMLHKHCIDSSRSRLERGGCAL